MVAASDPITLTVSYTPAENGWITATLLECPAVVTCGRDVDEARAMLCDALREQILAQIQTASAGPATETTSREQLLVTIAASPRRQSPPPDAARD